ncbi:MAG: OmpA family protein [Bacteroidales bacterium]|nr:OmpA family protein [Bacteroidales bacterium]
MRNRDLFSFAVVSLVNICLMFFVSGGLAAQDVQDSDSIEDIDSEIDYTQGLVLSNIKFAAMSDKLFSSSYPSLDLLVSKMRRLSHLQINIVSFYSDYVDDAYNEKLAMQRALSIKEYLVSQRISPDRVLTEGIGEQIKSKDYELKGGKTTMIKVYYRNSQSFEGYSNVVILKDIKFGKLGYLLFASSYPTLDRLANILEKNRQIDILISSFTDSEGNDEFNLKLSQFRADVIKNYLVSRGINQSRITTLGQGEKNPVLPNTSLAGRKRNNRVEVSFKRKY